MSRNGTEFPLKVDIVLVFNKNKRFINRHGSCAIVDPVHCQTAMAGLAALAWHEPLGRDFDRKTWSPFFLPSSTSFQRFAHELAHTASCQ